MGKRGLRHREGEGNKVTGFAGLMSHWKKKPGKRGD